MYMRRCQSARLGSVVLCLTPCKRSSALSGCLSSPSAVFHSIHLEDSTGTQTHQQCLSSLVAMSTTQYERVSVFREDMRRDTMESTRLGK
nr:hypothetical protein CFP56_22114 [Quercus suber]